MAGRRGAPHPLGRPSSVPGHSAEAAPRPRRSYARPTCGSYSHRKVGAGMTTVHRSAPAPVVLAGFLAAVAAVAVVGSLAATRSRDVYTALNQPSWAPPSWLFGPVWTVLYVVIAVSGWLYWRAGGTRREFAWYAAGL